MANNDNATKTNGKSAQEPVTHQFGSKDISIAPLGWKHARNWTDRLLTTLKPYMALLSQWKDINQLDIETEAGQSKLLEIVELIMQKAPNEVFDLVSTHRSLVGDREYIEENATTLQIARAFATMLEFELPLDQIRLIFGPLMPKTSRRPATASGASVPITTITNQP